MKKDKVLKQIERLNILKEHWQPLWLDVQKKLDTIKDPVLQIKYLEDKYHDYMEEIISTPELLNTSGDYISSSYPHPLGMDALIENKIQRIKKEFNIKDAEISKIKKPLPSYTINYKSIDNIESICNRLKKDNYISSDVKLPSFRKIFNEVKFMDIKAPINWQGSIASLRYFIKLFPVNITNNELFHIASHCFTCNGKEISIKQLESAKQYASIDSEKLDEIKKLYLS